MNKIFEEKLEFLQLLSNPKYLIFLYNYYNNKNIGEKQLFINYLEHLRFFNNEKYILCLVYPESLLFLEFLIKILSSEDFLEDYEIKKRLEEIKLY